MKKYVSIKKVLLQADDSIKFLNTLASEGWQLKKAGSAFAQFKKSIPQDVNYYLQYDDKQLDRSFQLIANWDDIYVYKTKNKENSINAYQSLDDIKYTLSRYYSTKVIPICIFAVIGLLIMGFTASSMESLIFNPWTMNVYTCLFFFIMLAVILVIRCLNFYSTTKMIQQAKTYQDLNFKKTQRFNNLNTTLLTLYIGYEIIFLLTLITKNYYDYANKFILTLFFALSLKFVPIKSTVIKLLILFIFSLFFYSIN